MAWIMWLYKQVITSLPVVFLTLKHTLAYAGQLILYQMVFHLIGKYYYYCYYYFYLLLCLLRNLGRLGWLGLSSNLQRSCISQVSLTFGLWY